MQHQIIIIHSEKCAHSNKYAINECSLNVHETGRKQNNTQDTSKTVQRQNTEKVHGMLQVRGNETTICIIATAYKKLITGLLGKNIT